MTASPKNRAGRQYNADSEILYEGGEGREQRFAQREVTRLRLHQAAIQNQRLVFRDDCRCVRSRVDRYLSLQFDDQGQEYGIEGKCRMVPVSPSGIVRYRIADGGIDNRG